MTTYIKLTKGDIEKAKAPLEKGKRSYYYFQGVPGLVLQVTSAGMKSFQVYKRIDKSSAPYRKTLGHYPDLHPDHARAKALEELSILANVGDPRPSRLEQSQVEMTFGELFSQYLEKYAKPHTKTSDELEKNYERYFRNRWHNVPVSSIKRMDVQNWLKNIADDVREQKRRVRADGRHTANRNFDSFRAIINWGIGKEIIKLDGDPIRGIDKFKTKARERFLLPGDEFIRFMASVEQEKNPTIKNFVKLCLLTGMRSGNIMAMRWDEINFDLATWTIPETKNGDSHRVTLTPAAVELLEEIWDARTSNEWVLPGDGKTGHLVEPKNAFKKILERAQISDIRPHDLRRTVGSYMAIQGVDSKIIGKALAQRSAQATAIYARLTQDPVRSALENAQKAFMDPTKLFAERT